MLFLHGKVDGGEVGRQRLEPELDGLPLVAAAQLPLHSLHTVVLALRIRVPGFSPAIVQHCSVRSGCSRHPLQLQRCDRG